MGEMRSCHSCLLLSALFTRMCQCNVGQTDSHDVHFEDPTLLNLSGPVGDDFFKAFRPVWEGPGRGCLCMIMSLSLRIWVLAETSSTFSTL